MAMGCVHIEEATRPNDLAGQVIEDVHDEVHQSGSDRFGELVFFPEGPRNDVVVDDAILPLLHQPEHLTFEPIAGV